MSESSEPIRSVSRMTVELHREVVAMTTLVCKNTGKLDELLKKKNGSGKALRLRRKKKDIARGSRA